jgi:hypothetical protein
LNRNDTSGDPAAASKVLITFANVTSEGTISLHLSSVSKDDKTFNATISWPSNTTDRAKLVLDGSTFYIDSTIYEFDAIDDLMFDGAVTIQFPSNAISDEILLSSGDKSDLRLLQYDNSSSTWTDITVSAPSIDKIVNNNVGDIKSAIGVESIAGSLHRLGPVLLAVVNDTSFGASYFDTSPLSRMTLVGNWNDTFEAQPPEENAETDFAVLIKNNQRQEQEFTYLVQVIDNNGVVVSLNSYTEVLNRVETRKISFTLEPILERGSYTIELFVWNNLEAPEALSYSAIAHINIH